MLIIKNKLLAFLLTHLASIDWHRNVVCGIYSVYGDPTATAEALADVSKLNHYY